MSVVDRLLRDYSIVDLSFALEENIPWVETHTPFKHIPWETPGLADGHTAYTYGLLMDEHTGTHVDSTMHFPHTGHRWIDQIPIREFIGRCGVIDCRHNKPGTLVSEDDLIHWEKDHCKLSDVDALLFNFGWHRKFKPLPEGRSYLGRRPGLSRQAARYIVASGVKLVGCDTMSLDARGTNGSPIHCILLSKEVKVIESLANLHLAPPTGGLLMAVPLKIVHGSGSPVRAFMFVPRKH